MKLHNKWYFFVPKIQANSSQETLNSALLNKSKLNIMGVRVLPCFP